jgi:hypothetical protein
MLALADSIGPYINGVFASEAERDSLIPTPIVGQEVYTEDKKRKFVWDGTRWVTSMTNVPAVQLVQTVAQTGWASGTFNSITFTGADTLDRWDQHNPASNSSRIVLGSVPGWYLVGGLYCPAANSAATLFRACIALNGVRVAGTYVAVPGLGGSLLPGVPASPMLIQITNPGDYVELHGLVTAASGTLGTSVNGTDGASALWAIYQSGL